MTLSDLLFLASVLTVLLLACRILISALRGKWAATRRSALYLGAFLVLYVVALVSTALLMPRHFYAQSERRCFDDWCITVIEANLADNSIDPPCQLIPDQHAWVAVVEVSSTAKRIRQRAPDARIEMEDQQGTRYQPCAGSLPDGKETRRSLSDQLGPAESFRVLLPFRLPGNAKPAGLVMHHGDIPGVIIIGADQSLFHRPALLQITRRHCTSSLIH